MPSSFGFTIVPKDFFGLPILDAADVAFSATLEHVASDTVSPCAIMYSAGQHGGTCLLAARAGARGTAA